LRLFVTFEGCEGCGKSTQARLLRRRLAARSLAVEFVHEPGGTRLGDRVRYLLKWAKDVPISPSAELLLFNASRANLVDLVIRPALAQHKVVICDRFVDSTFAYQGYGRGIDLGLVRASCAMATQGLKPDLTVLLDIPVEEGLKRKAAQTGLDRFEQTDTPFHRRVRAGFLELAAQEPERWLVVDGTGSRADIKQAIWERVEGLIKKES
jgi:dTMP kinase